MNLLVDIHLTSGTRYISLEDIYALEFTRITEDGWERITEDGVSRITEESWFYKGNLAQEFEVSESIPDIFYGTVQAGDIEIILADDRTDSWVDIVAAEEIRGVKVVLRHEDRSFIAAGKITGWTIGNDVRIKIGIRADEIFDTLLPAAVVTAAAFTATAVDIGSPVPIVFGYAKNVPLANIQNNTTDDYYDYLIGYGPVESLWIDHSNGRGVKRDGVLVAESEYTFYDGSQGSPYSGYAFIRFVVEQKDFGGNFHSLSADVYGLELGGASADRNFANCIKALINNSTYGLNQSVNATSFAAAAIALPTTSWKCDGLIYEQQAAKDILDDLLLPARSWLYLNADGEWCITTDGTGTSAASFGDNDGYYDNCKVESVSCEDATKAIKTAFINYDDDAYQITLAIHTGFGVDKTYSLPFVADLTTAKKTLSYVYGRAKYADKKLTLAADSEARLLSPGNLISVTSSRHGLTAAVYRIVRINKKLTGYSLDCEGYDSSMFDDQIISSPTAQTGDYATHALKTIDSGTVGGMSITATEIKTSDGLVGLSSAVTGGTDWRFWAGHATPGSAPFRVDENGEAWLTSAHVSGAIEGGTIDIGGADATSFHVDANGNMWLGHADYASGLFRVSSAGAVVATSGTIAGFTINATDGFYAGTGVTRVQMKAGAGFWAGATAIGDALFSVTQAGVLKAVSGTIGGWILATNLLKSAASGARIELDQTNKRVSVIDGTEASKVVMGYLNGLAKHDGTGNWGAGDYGFWAAAGDTLQIDGDTNYKSGDWIVENDGSFLVQNATPATIIRLGTDSGKKGLFLYNASGTNLAKLVTDEVYIGVAGNYLQYTVAGGLVIRGIITADSGYIGGTSGWVISAGYIKDVAGVVGLSSVVTEGDDIRFFAGHATPSSAPFQVKESGAMIATSGAIGGWTIGSTTLANGTNIILDASNKKISINSATFGEKGVQLDYNGGTPRAYIGDGSTKFIKYDGTNTTGNFSGVVNMTAQGGCKVLLSGAQTIADRTTTTIHFNTESWDTRSEFNTSTYRFTLESDSKIIVTAQALSDWEDWYHGSQFSLFIYVNGVNVGGYGTSTLIPSDHEPLNGMRAAIVSNTLDLDANDYIEIKIYHGVDGYSGSSIDIITTYNSTYLTIQKVA